jgi:hypothetical protein
VSGHQLPFNTHRIAFQYQAAPRPFRFGDSTCRRYKRRPASLVKDQTLLKMVERVKERERVAAIDCVLVIHQRLPPRPPSSHGNAFQINNNSLCGQGWIHKEIRLLLSKIKSCRPVTCVHTQHPLTVVAVPSTWWLSAAPPQVL